MRVPFSIAPLLVSACILFVTVPNSAQEPSAPPDEVVLHVEESGSPAAPPLVALHGFGASSYTWRDIRATLAERFHVYEIDLKGFGQSPKPEDDRYSVHDQRDLVVRFIADHHLEHVTLMGHSFGGGVALDTAVELMRTRPGTLKSLVLIDAASFKQSLPFFVEVLRWPILGRAIQSVSSDKAQVRVVLRKAYFKDRRIPDASVEAYAAALGMPGGKYALRETAKHIVPDDIDELTAAYRKIDVPTLILWGKHDEIVPLEIGRRLHETIAGSVFEVIQDAGHIPHEETPEKVRAVLARFFN